MLILLINLILGINTNSSIFMIHQTVFVWLYLKLDWILYLGLTESPMIVLGDLLANISICRIYIVLSILLQSDYLKIWFWRKKKWIYLICLEIESAY